MQVLSIQLAFLHYHESFGYTSYLALHFPLLGILKLVLVDGLVLALFPDRIHPQEGVVADAASAATPSEVAMQWRVGVILLVTLALWMTDSLHGINPAWVGMATAVTLLLPRVGVVAPKNFNSAIDFGVVLFVAAALGLGALVIADAGLGTINAVVLTIEHLQMRHIPVRGIIFNNYIPGDLMQDDNRKMIEAMTGIPVLAKVRHGDTELSIDTKVLAGLYR